jgi:hypothetical protein
LGQAPPISADAEALAGSHSPDETKAADGELEEDVKLSSLRGTFGTEESIHSLISWTTRKDYPTYIGISLSVKNWVGSDFHEIEFWEDTAEHIQFAHTAKDT